jgi:hypothetical protein
VPSLQRNDIQLCRIILKYGAIIKDISKYIYLHDFEYYSNIQPLIENQKTKNN